MGSMLSEGQMRTTDVPLQTVNPSSLVSSVILNGSSGSEKTKENTKKKNPLIS